MSRKKKEPDLIVDGFHRLERRYLSDKPPKIKWGVRYQAWPDREKISYLEKLAATMNHAAFLVQGERDQFGALCEKKEAQIVAMKKALDENNNMIQSEITRQNKEKQELLAVIAKLNARVRELERGGNN